MFPLLAPGIGPIGPFELIIILVIVLLVFGVGRLPEVGGAIGRGIREFRNAAKDDDGAPPPADAADRTSADVAAPNSDVAADNAVFCGECGTRNARGAKFCTSCGAAIGAPVG